MKSLTLIAASLVICLSAAAQPGGQNPGPKDHQKGPEKPQLTVEQEAQMRVDRMAEELPLTEKQVKKLTKYYKKDIEYRRENFEQGAGFPKGFPGGPGGFPGGQRPDFQGGRPEGGFPGGGPGGQRPDFQGGRPPMMGGEVDIETIEKYNAKQEKKLKKILGDDLYNQWRAKHPQERPKLPDVELQ